MSLPTLPRSADESGADPSPPATGSASSTAGPSMVSRRSWLCRAGVAGATAVVLATGVLSYRVFDTAVLDPDGGKAYDPWRTWRSVGGPLGTVAAAILAANPHNTQPWFFHVTDSAIDVYADPARRIGTVDVAGREHHVGLGCAIENLVIAARAKGFVPTVTLLPSGSASDAVDHVAHVALAAGPAERSPLYEAIGSRHSNRGPYRATPVSAGLLSELVDTTGLSGVDVHWITDETAKAALGQLMLDAAHAVVNDQQQSIDGFAWFRSNDDAIRQHRDGLTLDEQGLSPLMLAAAKLLPSSTRSAGDTFWVDQTRNVHIKTAAAYGVLTAADSGDVETQLTGGRLLQRVHLTASSRGVAMQHMNQITERIDREQETGAPATFAPRFAELLPAGVRPLVAFRVGYPARAARPSPRRSLAAVTR